MDLRVTRLTLARGNVIQWRIRRLIVIQAWSRPMRSGFVSAGSGGGTGLFYVHADHLGTPQKMTDGNQAIVWDAVYKPFGETHSITGTALNNQRFPGQYFDQETSFHQNWFRD